MLFMENQLEEYEKLRGKIITKAVFEELVFIYPLLAVLEIDRNFDDFEQHFIEEQVEQRAKINPEVGMEELQTEVSFMIKDFQVIKAVLLKALNEHIQTEEDAEHLLDMMLSSARVSSGDWNNNVLYSDDLPEWLSWSKWLIGGFLPPHTEKQQVSEEEKNVILDILEKVNGLTPRNIEVLKQIA